MPSKIFAGTVAAAGTAAALAFAATALPAHASDDADWQSVGKGKTSGVSGIAVTAHPGASDDDLDAVFVRDNKDAGQNRISAVTYRQGKDPKVTALDWKGGELPADLEALDGVPGEADGYVAVASSGTAYHVKVADGAATVLSSFELPDVGSDDSIEDFTLAAPPSAGAAGSPERTGGARAGEQKLAAVWADRGDDDRSGTLHAAPVSFGREGGARFGAVQSAEVRAPYPKDDVRHASDAELTDSGALLVTAAADPGDDGPFDSAVYTAAHVSLDGSGAVRLTTVKDPEAKRKFPGHKTEALDCVPGSGRAVLGSDDENDGGSLTAAGGICDE